MRPPEYEAVFLTAPIVYFSEVTGQIYVKFASYTYSSDYNSVLLTLSSIYIVICIQLHWNFINHLLWNTLVLENLIVALLALKEFYDFYGIKTLVLVFRRACRWFHI
jgi:hypothetical protein